MKILAIRGKNLASLEGEFEIDFTAEPLRSAGIFAITGNTGAGKSTLLDALCLALFDDTPRTNRASENIALVDVGAKTINQKDSRNILRRGTSDGMAEVDFVSLGGEIFRSTWCVRRARGKAGGSLQATEFKLYNLSTNVEEQGRKTELLAKVSDLIGLSFEQFTRAVLLAQGEFATFLKAKQNEKAELLEKLTGTEVYSRISTSIYERTKAAEAELKSLTDRMEDVELLPDDALLALTEEKTILSEEIARDDAAILRTKAALKWLADAESLKTEFQQAEQELVARRQALAEVQPRMDYLSRLDGLQEIRSCYLEDISVRRQLTEARSNLASQEKIQGDSTVQLEGLDQELATCVAEQKRLAAEFTRLEPQLRRARELDVRLGVVINQEKDIAAEYDKAVKAIEALRKLIGKHQSAFAQAGERVSRCDQWQEQHRRLEALAARVEDVVKALNTAAMLRQSEDANRKTMEQSAKLLELEQQKLITLGKEEERLGKMLASEIAVLRQRLEDGTPCPVCGSLHHPSAGMIGDTLAEQEINNARMAIQEEKAGLVERIEQRKEEVISLKSLQENYAAQIRDSEVNIAQELADVPDWQLMLQEGELVPWLRRLAQDWTAMQSSRQEAITQRGTWETTLKLEVEQLQQEEERVEMAKKNLDACREAGCSLSTERAGLLDGKSADAIEQNHALLRKTWDDRFGELSRNRQILSETKGKADGAIAQLNQSIRDLGKREEELQQELASWLAKRENGMSREQLVSMLGHDSQWIAHERAELNVLQQDVVSSQATLTERNKALLQHAESADKASADESTESLKISLDELTQSVDMKRRRAGEIELSMANHQNGKEKIKAFERELKEKGQLAENWAKLNALYGSADGAKFKVLAQGYTLEALLSYANHHLQELTSRYVLQRVPDTLALQVVDQDMLGEVRAVHSLSGGESFLISLALALGLSSLSSNRMNVESLFIDEGFGSLDIDTLRVAMDALERLQTQGRKIGVISHVAEMTERIATQIRVVKTAGGASRIEVGANHERQGYV